MKKAPRFSGATLRFLLQAARQKRPDWLERNREQYDECLLLPLRHFAQSLKTELAPLAPGYHFPVKGIGRLRRPSHRVEKGQGIYKNWIAYSASVPTGSRFDHNPNLFFLINPEDKSDRVLVAGGLYMPTSRETRAIREAIAADASAFDQLFSDRAFARRFRGGFSKEKISSRVPRGFDPQHPRIEWIRLQAFFVWRSYKMKEFTSPRFPALVAQDWKQILRLNALLTQAIQGRWPKAAASAKASKLLDRLSEINPEIENRIREMDF